jgi:hypothetical protein
MNIYFIMAETHGRKAVDYERVKVTVCGMETLTRTLQQPLIYTF